MCIHASESNGYVQAQAGPNEGMFIPICGAQAQQLRTPGQQSHSQVYAQEKKTWWRILRVLCLRESQLCLVNFCLTFLQQVQVSHGISAPSYSSHTGIGQPQGAAAVVAGTARPRVRARRGQATDPHSIAERVYHILYFDMSLALHIPYVFVDNLFHNIEILAWSIIKCCHWWRWCLCVTASARKNRRQNESFTRARSKCKQGMQIPPTSAFLCVVTGWNSGIINMKA